MVGAVVQGEDKVSLSSPNPVKFGLFCSRGISLFRRGFLLGGAFSKGLLVWVGMGQVSFNVIILLINFRRLRF